MFDKKGVFEENGVYVRDSASKKKNAIVEQKCILQKKVRTRENGGSSIFLVHSIVHDQKMSPIDPLRTGPAP